MPAETVENAWFKATFPSEVEVRESELPSVRGTAVAYEAQVEPFGIFAVEVTNMPLDAFIAVGAGKWLAMEGDRLVEEFKDRSPQVTHDESRHPVPGLEVRDLVFRFEYHGPCMRFCRVVTVLAGDEGRILHASAVVDASEASKDAAREFLAGLEVEPPELPTKLPEPP